MALAKRANTLEWNKLKWEPTSELKRDHQSRRDDLERGGLEVCGACCGRLSVFGQQSLKRADKPISKAFCPNVHVQTDRESGHFGHSFAHGMGSASAREAVHH